jgi:hypothetical protein
VFSPKASIYTSAAGMSFITISVGTRALWSNGPVAWIEFGSKTETVSKPIEVFLPYIGGAQDENNIEL